MKKILILFLLAAISIGAYSQCPTCPVGSTVITIPSAAGITISSGTVTCLVGSGSYTGNINLNGGTLYVGNGVNYNPGSQNFSGTNIINNCGTLSKTFNQSNLTINNYSNNATISYVIDNGVNFNNYATNVTLNVNSGNPNNSVNITNSVGSSITVVTNTSNSNCSSSLGNPTNITNDGDMIFPNSLCMKNGLITNNKNISFNGQLAMDGGTLETKAGSNTSINTLRKNNGSINVYSGTTLSISNLINFDGNSIKMMDPGCSYLTLATPPSSSFNTNFIDNGPNVWPNGINYCGGVPRNSAASGTTISSVANSFGTYRITLPASGTNAPNNGDYIYITGVVGGTLNGYWKVTKISNYVYDLVSSAYSPITSLSSNFVYTNNLRLGNGTYMGETGCSNPCVPLPLVFTYFNVNSIAENTCKISFGINISYSECIIQSSVDGRTFIDLYSTTNNKNVSYNTSTEGTTYYRIKCIGTDGEVFYSQMKVNESNDYARVEIYPNPTSDGVVNITWNHLNLDDITTDVTFEIIDINGNLIKNVNVSDYKENFLLLELPKGVYILKIFGNEIYKTFKIISL